jgi:serine/threonine-protein kinase HipA
MLGATDGHARNFSLFIGRAGGFSMTPLYDVLSAYPIIGRGRNKLAPEKALMAMSVRGRSKHYHWSRISRRHWLESAKAWGMADQAPGILAELIETTPEVLGKIQAALPGDFPAHVAEPILKGLGRAARTLQGPA